MANPHRYHLGGYIQSAIITEEWDGGDRDSREDGNRINNNKNHVAQEVIKNQEAARTMARWRRH